MSIRDASGLCCDKNKLIEIEKGLKPELELEVFIHEWIHAVWYEAGIDNQRVSLALEHMLMNPIQKDMVINARVWAKVFSSYVDLLDSE